MRKHQSQVEIHSAKCLISTLQKHKGLDKQGKTEKKITDYKDFQGFRSLAADPCEDGAALSTEGGGGITDALSPAKGNRVI